MSPNSISERSTRYVSMGSENGKVESAICRPWWLSDEQCQLYKDGSSTEAFDVTAYLNSCEYAFEHYSKLLAYGLKPEDARGVLPLQTLTKVVYTYSMKEWRHIIDLRYFGTTGKPHPEAKIVAGMIKGELEKLGYTISESEIRK